MKRFQRLMTTIAAVIHSFFQVTWEVDLAAGYAQCPGCNQDMAIRTAHRPGEDSRKSYIIMHLTKPRGMICPGSTTVVSN